jgi:hypothetical protein
MGENVIRIEIVMAPIEISSYKSIDTVALNRGVENYYQKGRK